jgi:hypothetical protein
MDSSRFDTPRAGRWGRRWPREPARGSEDSSSVEIATNDWQSANESEAWGLVAGRWRGIKGPPRARTRGSEAKASF